MFKKRATQKTKAELDTILTQITTQQQYPQSLGVAKGDKNQTNNQNQSLIMSAELNGSENHQTGTKYDKSNGKYNVYQIGAASNPNKRSGLNNAVLKEGNQMQFGNIDLVSEGIIKNTSQVHQVVNKNPQQLKELEDCFAEFMEIQKQQENKSLQQYSQRQGMQRHHPSYLRQQQDIGPGYTQMIEENLIHSQQDYPQQQKIKPKPLPMIHEVIIQDQSGEQIEICEDYGQISPDSDQSNNSQYFKQSLQNKIIRQALTKRNYDRLKPNLEPEVHSSQKTKLIKKLERISFGSIRKKMLKDLEEQKNRKNEIASEIKHLQQKVVMRKKQMEEQMVNKQKLQQQLQKVKGMIELLFYFGSEIEIKGLKIDKLAHLAEDPQWKQKLQLVRNKIRRNRKEYEAKKKNQINDDIEKQEGSDVEQIGTGKFNEWGNDEEFEVVEDQVDEKEQKNESKGWGKKDGLIESQEDDDQYMQIDDD